jgi:transcriptional regulator with XRE-family HTH domain
VESQFPDGEGSGVPDSPPQVRRSLAIAVRELRARQGLTQEEVAFGAKLGRNYISDLESGRMKASFEAIWSVSQGLGVPLMEVVRVFQERLDEALPRQSEGPAGASPSLRQS